MTARPRRRLRGAGIALLTLAALVVMFGVLAQRSTPDLAPWHTVELDEEFRARDAGGGFTWNDYLRLEDSLFRELDREVVTDDASLANPNWSRFAAGGINNPSTFPTNWNRSFEMTPPSPVGAALLIHGLTDSPYSLRRPAELLRARGFRVLGLRLPGHGTAPTALKDATVDDWRAAVRIAARYLQATMGGSGRYVLVGYSNGGALALDLALDALDDDELRVPDRVVLFSPAVGITRVAVLARGHRALSFMPFFEKLEWNGVKPEYDPFKYNSFPKDAGYETHVLTRSVRARFADLQQRGNSAAFPPVQAFMSLADATVHVEAVVDGLFERLSRPDNELVIFDINREAGMRGFFRGDPADRMKTLMERPTTSYRLTVLTNRNDESPALVAHTRAAGETEFSIADTGLEWPRGIYSLSHVAVPFPPDDPVYGLWPAEREEPGVRLGAIEPRGERGLLAVSVEQLTRLRSNPFFSFVEQRLDEGLASPSETVEDPERGPPDPESAGEPDR